MLGGGSCASGFDLRVGSLELRTRFRKQLRIERPVLRLVLQDERPKPLTLRRTNYRIIPGGVERLLNAAGVRLHTSYIVPDPALVSRRVPVRGRIVGAAEVEGVDGGAAAGGAGEGVVRSGGVDGCVSEYVGDGVEWDAVVEQDRRERAA